MEGNLKKILSAFKGNKEELIPVLQAVQESKGFLPQEDMLQIARFLRVPPSRIYAVATFYAQFRFKPIGKKRIMACRGTACHVRGAARILEEFEKQLGIKEGETTADGEYSLETVACIGACSLAPCVMVNKEVKAQLTPKKVAVLFEREGA